MKSVLTKVDDVVYQKITATGKPSYQFLREAIDLKLQQDEMLSIDKTIELSLSQHLKKIEMMQIEALEVNRQLVNNFLEKFHQEAQKSHEKKVDEIADRFKSLLEKIFAILKSIKGE